MIDSVQGSLEMFLVPNTWVKHDVEQIDEEIDDYESETDEQTEWYLGQGRKPGSR
jgi:hypothetical protein